MEISSYKMQIMKPIVVKAGIPLAVTLAGFIVAKIVARGSSPPATSSPPSKTQANVKKTDSCEILTDDHSQEKSCELHEEILGLKCKIQDFQSRQWRLETRFLLYQESKEQEIALMELHHKFMLEINRVELLHREITLLESEKQRFDNIVSECLEILRLFGNKIELETRDDCARLMKDEKDELSTKSEAGGETPKIENEKQVTCELDRLYKDESTEVKELMYLRWLNASLRHEQLTNSQEQEEEHKEIEHNFEEFVSDRELSVYDGRQSDSNLSLVDQKHHHQSKRRKLFEKFRRWVEKEKHVKNKCFQGQSKTNDGAKEAYFSSRKSCSSV
ncbi:hypothetical protein CASFOL_013457 [Castilleja foliolosa]|uniref:Uncharacterized protein n=1 Tax=Castilleja foliolosa TaxID=1961234 RepID=A0ABD3DKR5_9LAMI